MNEYGYHKTKISRGQLGELSKIQEELDEAFDAESQWNKILILCELSDLIGAVHGYLKEKFPDISLQDLIQMSEATEAAFKAGKR